MSDLKVGTTKIIDLLNQEKLSMYDAGKLLEAIGKLFTEFEGSMLRDACFTIEDAEAMLHHAKELAAKLNIWYDRYDEISQKNFDKAEEVYSKVFKAYSNLKNKIEKLPKIEVPYISSHSLKELVEISERLHHLDEKTWRRVLDLAEALVNK